MSHTFNLTRQDGKSSESYPHHFPVTYFSLADCSFYYFSPKIKAVCSSAGESRTLARCGNKHHRTEGAGVGREQTSGTRRNNFIGIYIEEAEVQSIEVKKT